MADAKSGITVGHDGLYLKGQRLPVYSGAVHYWRHDPQLWADILEKVKGMGFGVVTTYIPWEIHELGRGGFDFGRVEPGTDIDRFLTVCEEKGLKVITRPGPQINSELTGFGFPARILADPELQARSAQGSKAVLTQVPRPIPALSYTSEKFFAETALWYDAICPILSRHAWPRGGLVAVQVDNEMGFFFHINPYMADYSPSSVEKYREFLEKKYGTIERLNEACRLSHRSFREIDPPRRFEGERREELPYYLDWIEYRERYLIDSLVRLAGMLRERGLAELPIFHNYPHPLGPGGSAGATTTPFNLPGLEEKLDFVGFDIYSTRELYDHVKTIVSYVAGCSRFPYIPEFISVVWPWYLKPAGPLDEDFVTKAAFMHGIKGFTRYTIVERNKWMGSPLTRRGEIREERYRFFRKVNELLERHGLADYEREEEVAVLANREYDRLQAATALLPVPADFLEPLFGFSEYPDFTLVSERDFGLGEPVQLAKAEWFNAFYSGLSEAGYPFLLGDTSLPQERLGRYRALLVSSFEFMSAALQRKLLDFARGGLLVLAPRVPALDEYFRPDATLAEGLRGAESSPITLDGEEYGVRSRLGKGSLVVLLDRSRREPGRVLDRVLHEDGISKIAKNDARLDVIVHRSRTEPGRRIAFVANPTAELIQARVEPAGLPEAVREIWEERDVKTRDGRIAEELPPYTLRIYAYQAKEK